MSAFSGRTHQLFSSASINPPTASATWLSGNSGSTAMCRIWCRINWNLLRYYTMFIFCHLVTSESYISSRIICGSILSSISSLVRIIMPKYVPFWRHHDVIVVKSTTSAMWIEAKNTVRCNLLTRALAECEVGPTQFPWIVPNLVWLSKLFTNLFLCGTIILAYFTRSIGLASSSVRCGDEVGIER